MAGLAHIEQYTTLTDSRLNPVRSSYKVCRIETMIDYNTASKTYDNTRGDSDRLIERFGRRIAFDNGTAVLDFGCGTGSYLNTVQSRFGCRCHGVDPSEGMRALAVRKNKALDVREGNHRRIPFDDNSFDFAFMTDVIHHVPDLSSMFMELFRVLNPRACLCIVTESHEQIQARFYNVYFPSLAANEKKRYPDIPAIVTMAQQCGFVHETTEVLPAVSPAVVTRTFLRNVEEKNYSMFHLLEEREFEEGLSRIRKDEGRRFTVTSAGETLIWLGKESGTGKYFKLG